MAETAARNHLGALAASAISLIDGRSTVYFDTATMLITLLLVGGLIETRARRDAARATESRDRLFEDTAERLRPDGRFEPTAAKTLGPGDIMRVQAGAVSTGDGVITEGDSRLDTAMLTGESKPRTVGPGDRLATGHLNLTRPLTIQVDRVAGDRDIDQMGGRVALEIAARGEPIDRGDQIAAGLTRIGVRIAEPAALARMAALRAVVFDKTGTLTLGRPHVVAIDPSPGGL